METTDDRGRKNPYIKQAKTLADARAPRTPSPAIVRGIVHQRALNIWYGAPGDLKSVLLMDLCFAVITGKPWLPSLPSDGQQIGGHQTMATRVLWVDVDNGDDLMCERLSAFASAHGLGEVDDLKWLSFPTPPITAARGLKLLTECALDQRAGLIVIDNLLRVAGVKDENSSEMDTAMGNLRKLTLDARAAVQIIHHRRKDTGSGGRAGDALRGHSSIEGAIDTALLVQRDGDVLTIKSTKTRRRPIEPFGAMWTFALDADGEALSQARFYRADLPDSSVQAAESDLRNQILLALRNGPANQLSIVQAVSKRRETVITTLNGLVSSGAVVARRGARNEMQYTAA